jgi:hypothetical protein
MRSFLANKNLCLYYWLRKRVGKKRALWVAHNIEKGNPYLWKGGGVL